MFRGEEGEREEEEKWEKGTRFVGAHACPPFLGRERGMLKCSLGSISLSV